MSYRFSRFALFLCSFCVFAACTSDDTEEMEEEYPWVINYDGYRQVDEKLFVVDEDKKLNEIPVSGSFEEYSSDIEQDWLQTDTILEFASGIKLTVLNETDIQLRLVDESDQVIRDTVVEYYIENDRLIIPAMDPNSGLTYDPDNRELITYFTFQGLFPGPNAVQDSFFHRDIFYYETDSFSIWHDYKDPEYAIEGSFPLDTYYLVLYHIIHK